MRLDLVEAFAPVCPRCLHTDAGAHPIVVASQLETRAGHLWHGILHCSNSACWMEFPVIDGVPVIVPDPRGVLTGAEAHIMARSDLPFALESLMGDAIGPGATFDATRQHISIYAGDHYADWIDPPGQSYVASAALAGMGHFRAPPDGSALDLGCAMGRGTWELARAGFGPVIGLDLNLSMLRIAQRLLVEGEVTFSRRRVGVVYDPVTVRLPEAFAGLAVDFWASDATQPPFQPGGFNAVAAINVVDCISDPAALLVSAHRNLVPGGEALFTTPFDWSPTAVGFEQWIGGHSQRGPHGGASEPALQALLMAAGFQPGPAIADVPWVLRLHARSSMEYTLHLAMALKPL